jgi:hypothetical protein
LYLKDILVPAECFEDNFRLSLLDASNYGD